MRLFRHELRGELLLYVRSRELAFFTFLLPMVFFVLLGSTYRHDRIESEGNVRAVNYLLAGMIGYGAIAIAFAGLAIVLVIRRESGVLKRLRATLSPAPAYIAALLTAFLAAFAVEAVALIVLGECSSRSAHPTTSPRSCSRCCSGRSASARWRRRRVADQERRGPPRP